MILLLVDLPLVLLALLGHLALWIGVYNRLHATALSCKHIKMMEKLVCLTILFIPALFVWRWLATGQLALAADSTLPQVDGALVYLAPCWAIALGVVPRWLWRQLRPTSPPALISNDTTTVDIAGGLQDSPWSGLSVNFLARVPGNQIGRLDVQEKTIALPRLSAELDGFSIAHLSDLHYTGQISLEYFQSVIDQTNRLDADLIAVTGDIVDMTWCIDWIPRTLGRLQSRYGVYSILGNHDQRVADVDHLRRVLRDSSLIDLGGRWKIVEIRGEEILLAGNELPWFGPAADMQHAPPRGDDGRPLRILLAHTPDQFPWARSFDFDVVLAGHTHGGQIRFPLIGPIVAPSRFGVRYASGVFFEEPTLMHVSRGVSGLHPIRINCPPELTRLVFRRG